MVLRQCLLLPAALGNGLRFPISHSVLTTFWYRRSFHSTVCSSSPRIRPNASRKGQVSVDSGRKSANAGVASVMESPLPPLIPSNIDKEFSEDEEESDASEVQVVAPQENDPRGILFNMFIPPHLEGRRTRQLFGSNIHVRHEASKVVLKSVEFIKSSSKESECPKDGFPEFAMVGRSNVGKSSLVNLLVERKNIAMTSKKPGKTQLINHFLVNKSWYLVDLPGYGYAKAPKTLCINWNEFTKGYFLSRKTLVMVVLLVDSSIPPQQIDLDCATWLGKNNIPTTLAFTKCDKRKKQKKGGRHPTENLVDFLQQLKQTYSHTPPWILTSCATGQGKEDLMLHMTELRKYWHS